MILHGRNLLLNDRFPDKFRKLVGQKLEARGIELVLGDYVATFPENGGGEVAFRSGSKIQADLVVRTPSWQFRFNHRKLLTGHENTSHRFQRTGLNQTPYGYLTL